MELYGDDKVTVEACSNTAGTNGGIEGGLLDILHVSLTCSKNDIQREKTITCSDHEGTSGNASLSPRKSVRLATHQSEHSLIRAKACKLQLKEGTNLEFKSCCVRILRR